MAARVVGVERDDVVGLRERPVCRLLVARLPVIDVVRLLPLLVVPDERSSVGKRLIGARHRLQRLVVDVDQLESVLRDVRVLGDDRGHLLALEADLVRREHGLRVARKGRHPGEVVLGHQFAGHDGDDSGQGSRTRGVDRHDPRVRERAAQQLEVEHPGELHVLDVRALATDEALVLLALDGVAEALHFLGRHRLRLPHCGRRMLHRLDDVLVAGDPASRKQSRLLPHRGRRMLHRLRSVPADLAGDAQRISSSVGLGLSARSATEVSIMPGVQNPH